MALLQISEPGQAPDPHQRRIAVGIDLGTTHSLVASVRNGVAECLPDDQGRVKLSRKALLAPQEGGDNGGGGDRGDRGVDRGDRGGDRGDRGGGGGGRGGRGGGGGGYRGGRDRRD